MPSPLALTTRAKWLLVAGLVVLTGLSVHRLLLVRPPEPYVAFGGDTMGTTFEVKLATRELPEDDFRRAKAACEQAIDEVVDAMSSWEPDSEVSRFNAHRSTDPFAVSPLTFEVMQAAAEVNRMTRGAFDVTVAPLVALWGFGPNAPALSMPADERIVEVASHVGQRLLELDPAAHTLRKLDPELAIDLSGIAQGFASDQVALALEALGHRDYLVDVGGELRAAGTRRDGRPWRVAIERPAEETLRAIHVTIDLRDAGMATSGDYRSFYDLEGVRVSQTIDPRTGRPIAHDLASVSVVHPSAMWADALATGLNVLGPAAGYHVAETLGLTAYFIVRRDGSFQSLPTTAMQGLLPGPDTSEPRAPGE
ncbi:MAG TPA: FAD:protein FMN transferase [Planctomycetota bacterium]|nr:FAD:protein FMN transferase [Planctomycetota bacterium]